MAGNLVEPQLEVAGSVLQPPGRSAPRSAPAGLAPAVLAPVVVALSALAVHVFLPDEQLAPLSWLDALPTWRHPYPVVLGVVLIGSVLAVGAQALFASLRESVRHFAPLVAGAVGVLTAWELVTTKLNWLHQPFFPGPNEVFGAIVEDRVLLLECAGHSLRLLLSGYLVGVTAGLVTGILVGWFPRIRYWVMPALKFVGPIPATALIVPVMTIWKDSFTCAVALIGFAVWFPMTILTSSGIANVRLSYIDVARTLGAGRFYLIFRVAVPAAMPNIFVGLFMGLGASFLTLVVAEAAGVKAGLGWYLGWQKGYMEYAKMYGALIVCAGFFSALMTVLFKLRDRVLKWQKGVIKW
jgi:NitT/TauT family transport system permease protein